MTRLRLAAFWSKIFRECDTSSVFKGFKSWYVWMINPQLDICPDSTLDDQLVLRHFIFIPNIFTWFPFVMERLLSATFYCPLLCFKLGWHNFENFYYLILYFICFLTNGYFEIFFSLFFFCWFQKKRTTQRLKQVWSVVVAVTPIYTKTAERHRMFENTVDAAIRLAMFCQPQPCWINITNWCKREL